MLGRLKRTTRLDVGLVLSFAGLAYLVWALVAGVSRNLVQELINSTTVVGTPLPTFTRAVKIFFVDAGFVIDVVGVAWLIASLALVLLSSRQKISVSWAWLCATLQVMAAALGAVLVGWAAYAPYIVPAARVEQEATTLETVSRISLPVMVPVAILVWVTFVIWLLVERARLDRHGPTLTDGMRTNVR